MGIIKNDLKELLNLEKSIRKLYLNLMECEKNNNIEEYNNNYEYIQIAKEYENKLINDLDTSSSSIFSYFTFLDNYVEEVIAYYFSFNDDRIEYLRLFNNLEPLFNLYDNNVEDDLNFLDIIKRKVKQNTHDNLEDYKDEFYKENHKNIVYIINKEIEDSKDQEYIDAIRKLKYDLLYTQPLLEKNFLIDGFKSFMPVNLDYNDCTHSRNLYKEFSYINISNNISYILTYLNALNFHEWNDQIKYIHQCRIKLLSYLTMDIELCNKFEDNIQEFISNNKITNEEIAPFLFDIIEDSKEYIQKNNAKKNSSRHCQ